jgi:hypothetical protein
MHGEEGINLFAFVYSMTTDDRLRQSLIDASRRRALEDRRRLLPTSSTSIGVPLVFAAAGLALGCWAALGRKRRLATAAFALGGCVWLALRRTGRPVLTRADEQDSGSDDEMPLVDQTGRQSFPASDPPPYSFARRSQP